MAGGQDIYGNRALMDPNTLVDVLAQTNDTDKIKSVLFDYGDVLGRWRKPVEIDPGEMHTLPWYPPQPTYEPPAIDIPPAAPATQSGTATDVALLLGRIPIAEDGHVITAEYHNSLRAALIGLSSGLGDAGINRQETLSLTPVLRPLDDKGELAKKGRWELKPEVATPYDEEGATGWIPVDLPEGVRIQQAGGVYTYGGDGELAIQLNRTPFESPDEPQELAVVKPTAKRDDLEPDLADVAAPGLHSAEAAAEVGQVDNTKYRYWFKVTSQDRATRLFALTVVYSRW